jgi:hypothetical protein
MQNLVDSTIKMEKSEYSLKRFIGWIALFVVMLSLIPMLILLNYIVLAKFIGVVLIVSVTLALMYWRMQTKKRNTKAMRVAITINEKFWLLNNVSFYKALNKEDKAVFRDRVALFLSEVKVAILGNGDPDKTDLLPLAVNAVQSTWSYGWIDFSNFGKVLMYSDKTSDSFEKELRHLVRMEDFLPINIEKLTRANLSNGPEQMEMNQMWMSFIEHA